MRVRQFDSWAALEQKVVLLISEALQLQCPAPFAVMLTGGRTSQPVHASLARTVKPASSGLHLLISDERHVPPGSPEHNASKLTPLTAALHLPAERLLQVNTALPLEEAGADYDRRVQDFLSRGPIRLGILGLGVDGHLASLFTDEDLGRAKGRCAIAVRRPSPPDRISLTPSVLNGIERLVFIAAGADKADVVKRLMFRPRTVVAARALNESDRIECWFSPTEPS